jgi:hypothetical protein
VLQLNWDKAAAAASEGFKAAVPVEQTKIFRWRQIADVGAQNFSKKLDAEFKIIGQRSKE